MKVHILSSSLDKLSKSYPAKESEASPNRNLSLLSSTRKKIFISASKKRTTAKTSDIVYRNWGIKIWKYPILISYFKWSSIHQFTAWRKNSSCLLKLWRLPPDLSCRISAAEQSVSDRSTQIRSATWRLDSWETGSGRAKTTPNSW